MGEYLQRKPMCSLKVKLIASQLSGFASQSKLQLPSGATLSDQYPLGSVFTAQIVSIDFNHLRVEVANKFEPEADLYLGLNSMLWNVIFELGSRKIFHQRRTGFQGIEANE